MRQMAAAAAAKAAAAAAAASGVYEDAVIPAVTKARYADQDMCYINRRRPSRKYSSHQAMDTCSGGEGQLPPALSVGKQMSIHPDASSQVSRYVSPYRFYFKGMHVSKGKTFTMSSTTSLHDIYIFSPLPKYCVRKHHSVLMDPSVKNYQKLVKSAREFMSDEIEKLPLSKYE